MADTAVLSKSSAASDCLGGRGAGPSLGTSSAVCGLMAGGEPEGAAGFSEAGAVPVPEALLLFRVAMAAAAAASTAAVTATTDLPSACSGFLYKSANLEKMAFTSSVLSTQLTKCAARDVAKTPRVGCALGSMGFLFPRGFFFFLSLQGTQQHVEPWEEWLMAGRLRSRRSECKRLHSARHRKCAEEGQKTHSGTRSKSGLEALPLPIPES
mmetsp:Transcript_10395/g.19092  ORF Transcript_10395/g.19092 Transcript_10395/m.19092 type:complete len:211 (-) Transcript_10395:1286-1918(-)